MTDDLVKRLREEANRYKGKTWECLWMAADRIEKLEKYQSVHAQCDKTSLELEEKLVKQLSEARKRIQMLEAALREIIQEDALTGKTVFVGDFGKIARKALEGKDD